jgi:hypothetical protein
MMQKPDILKTKHAWEIKLKFKALGMRMGVALAVRKLRRINRCAIWATIQTKMP